MTTQSENTEPKISKDELSNEDLAKVTGGDKNTTTKSASKTSTPVETVSMNYGSIAWEYTSQ